MRIYLAGPLKFTTEKEWIESLEWRKDIYGFLISLNHHPILPADITTTDLANPSASYNGGYMHSMDKLKAKFDVENIQDLRRFYRKAFLDPDIELIEGSDAIIAYIPFLTPGTSSECALAYFMSIPLYVVSALPLIQLRSIIGFSTEMFKSLDELKVYLKSKADTWQTDVRNATT